MAKYIKIEVDHPCSENWHEMTPNAQGSFCNSCKKTVIDFTTMTDNQLMEYFKRNPAGSCGRFHTDQLATQLAIPVKRIPWGKYFLPISLPALFFGFKANAQRSIKKYQEPVTIISKGSLHPVDLQSGVRLTGTITNTDGKPVAYASVMIEGSMKGVAADSSGVFKLQLNANDSILDITAAGYKKQSVKISSGNADIQLDIAMSDDILLDPVIMRSTRSTKMGAYSICRSSRIMARETEHAMPLTRAPISVFPNPVNKNGTVTIEWKNKISNDQLVTIYNMSGQKVDQQMISINHPVVQSLLTLHINTAGNYIMEVMDSKTHIQHSLVFMLE